MPSTRDETERRNRGIFPINDGGPAVLAPPPSPESLPAGSIPMVTMAALLGLDFAQVTCSVEEPGD